MAEPDVSVLLPVRDAAAYLPECIQSLRSQTFEDFEVLAVDDGSTDLSADILLQWAREDPRVVVTVQPALGIPAALEAARSRARGRYLARMDADDIAGVTRFEEQRALLESDAELAACGAGVRYFPRDVLRDGGLRYETWLNGMRSPADVERNLFVECPLAHPTFFLRSSAVSGVGGYADRGWPEDYDLLMRLWKSGAALGVVPRMLLHWRERDDRKIGQSIHGATVIPPSRVNEYRDAYSVAAVGQVGARDEIRSALQEAGWREVSEFIAVA